MKISTLIFLSISTVLLLFSFTTLINFKQSEEVVANAEYLTVSSNIVRLSNQFQRNILYMERGLRGYAIMGQDYFFPTYDSTAVENEALLQELSNLVSSDSTQQRHLFKIQHLYQRWKHEFAQPLRNARESGGSAAYDFRQAVQIEESINQDLQKTFRNLINIEYTKRASRQATLETTEWKTKVISFTLTALSIVIGLVIAFMLAVHIERRILRLVKMANAIAEGDYAIQLADTDKDELSTLTRSLNHMAETLAANISLLKRKNQELDQFAHIVSHDLKAPLRGIDNVITWLEEDHAAELSPQVNEYLQLIRGRIVRSENLIQGILTYARIGKEEQEKEWVDLNVLVRDVVDNLPEKTGLDVEIQAPLPVIFSEKLPLLQVFTNLISNAIKYHDKPIGAVRIYFTEEKTHYTFYVEDDGPGIASSYHDRIFVIFQTLQERDSFESTGVGLAIVKKILDDRQEQITISSTPGLGAVFSFTWSKL